MKISIFNSEDSLSHVQAATPDILLPSNTLNERDSAHFIEINAKYFELMSKEFKNKSEKIAKERLNNSPYDRIMKYADHSYKYETIKTIDN